ncbi:MAG TPA: hypothetical protein VNL14_18765 [Candidatus Acidoferrales bacterium]|nr:hypothetical protein [Candidatus Acidoferrales bacterium]
MRALGGFLVILLAFYFPAFVTAYAVSSDFPLLAATLENRGAAPPFNIAGDHPLYWYITNLAFASVGGFAELAYLRLLAVVLTAVVSWLLYRICLGAGWGRYEAFFVAVMVVTMPPFQVYVSWASLYLYPLAGALGAAALVAAEKLFRASEPGRSGAVRYAWPLAAVILLQLALAISAPAAMLFWAAAAVVLFRPGASLRHMVPRFSAYAAVVAASLALDLTRGRWAGLFHGQAAADSSAFKLPADVFQKLRWFGQEPLANALNLFLLFPASWIAVVAGSAIVIGLLLYLEESPEKRLAKLALALLIAPLSYLPGLLAEENWPAYRTLPALTAVLTLYAFFALCGYLKRLSRFTAVPPVAGVLALPSLLCGALAFYNVHNYFSLPLSIEYQWLRAQVLTEQLAAARRIYVVAASWRESIAPGVRYDEFGLPFSAQPYAVKPAVYIVLRESRPEKARTPVDLVSADAPFRPPPASIVVDMTKIISFRGRI